MEKEASAQQEKRILEAQAEAESIKLRGESRAFAIEARAKVMKFYSASAQVRCQDGLSRMNHTK